MLEGFIKISALVALAACVGTASAYTFRVPVPGLMGSNLSSGNSNATSSSSCLQYLQTHRGASSGAYPLVLPDGQAVTAYCDMATAGGGWTLIAKNANGANWGSIIGQSNISDLATTDVTTTTATKLSDAEINSFGYSAIMESVNAASQTTVSYVSGQCNFSLATPIAIPGACSVAYSDVGLTTVAGQLTTYSDSVLGLVGVGAGRLVTLSPTVVASGRTAIVLIYVR